MVPSLTSYGCPLEMLVTHTRQEILRRSNVVTGYIRHFKTGAVDQQLSATRVLSPPHLPDDIETQVRYFMIVQII